MTLAGDKLWVIALVVCLSGVALGQTLDFEKIDIIEKKMNEQVKWLPSSVNCVFRNFSGSDLIVAPVYSSNVELVSMDRVVRSSVLRSISTYGECLESYPVPSELKELECLEDKDCWMEKNNSCYCNESSTVSCITGSKNVLVDEVSYVPIKDGIFSSKDSFLSETETKLEALAKTEFSAELDVRAYSEPISSSEVRFCFRAPSFRELMAREKDSSGEISYSALSGATYDSEHSTWYNISYSQRIPINCSSIVNQTIPVVLNGSRGLYINGSWQVIWSRCVPTLAVYLNAYNDYMVANDTDAIPYEVELGNDSSSSDYTSLWTDYSLVLHGHNFSDSSPANWAITNSGVECIEATGTIGKVFNFSFHDLLTLPVGFHLSTETPMRELWWNSVDPQQYVGLIEDRGSSADTTTEAVMTTYDGMQSGVNDGTTMYWLDGSANPANTWMHYVLQVQANNSAILYKNNSLDVSIAISANPLHQQANSLKIGDYSTDGNYDFYGFMDEIRMGNMTYSSAERTQIWNNYKNVSGYGTALGLEFAGGYFSVSLLSVSGAGNNSFISDSTPEVRVNVSGAGNNYSCSIMLNGSVSAGTNDSVLNNTLTNITVNQTLSSKKYNISVSCTAMGTTNTTGVFNITVDATAPSTNASAITATGSVYSFGSWADTSYVNVSLNCSDGSEGIGCNVSSYCLDTVNSCTPNLPYSVPVSISTRGTSYIRYNSSDSLWNREAVKNQTIRLNDTLSPVITVVSPTASIYLTGSITVSFSATDDSAVDSLWFYNGTGNTSYTVPVVLTLSIGSYNFTFYANDTYGNLASTSVSFSVSSASPYGTSCLSNYSLASLVSIPSGMNITLVNLSGMPTYLSSNLSNVFASVPSWINSSYPLSLFVNSTGQASVSIYVGSTGTQSNAQGSSSFDYAVNISSANFTQYYPFYILNVREMTQGTIWDYDDSNSTTLRVVCNEGGYTEINLETFNETTLQMGTIVQPYRFLITYSAVGWNLYTTQAPNSNFSTLGLYLINPATNTTPVMMTFEMRDLSMLFFGARVELTTYVDGNLTMVASDYFEADNRAHFYLVDKDRYILTIEKDDESRQIGWLTVLSLVDTDITITLTGITGVEDLTRQKYFSYGFRNDFNSTTLSLVYSDSSGGVQDVGFFVYNSSESLLYEGHSSAQNATMNFITNTSNKTFIVRMTVNHSLMGFQEVRRALGIYNETLRVLDFGQIQNTPLGISSDTWYKIAGIGMMLMTASIFGAVSAGAGAIILGFQGLLFNYFGWFATGALQMALYPIFALFIFVAVVSKLSDKRRVI